MGFVAGFIFADGLEQAAHRVGDTIDSDLIPNIDLTRLAGEVRDRLHNRHQGFSLDGEVKFAALRE
ncbi:MAG TPA: hypothetical protein ENK45_02490 [Aliiroseovarius sp.]|nr:hypothetical protein [Aliiroseovarius sp.]